MGFLKLFLSLFVNITSTLLIIYCVMSWFVPPDFPVRRWLDGLMDQMLDPIRRILPSFGMFDLSPIVLMLLLQLLHGFVTPYGACFMILFQIFMEIPESGIPLRIKVTFRRADRPERLSGRGDGCGLPGIRGSAGRPVLRR